MKKTTIYTTSDGTIFADETLAKKYEAGFNTKNQLLEIINIGVPSHGECDIDAKLGIIAELMKRKNEVISLLNAL